MRQGPGLNGPTSTCVRAASTILLRTEKTNRDRLAAAVRPCDDPGPEVPHHRREVVWHSGGRGLTSTSPVHDAHSQLGRNAGVNTQAPGAAFKIEAAGSYCAKTKDFWSAMRARWHATTATTNGLARGQQADSGRDLLLIADDVAFGETRSQARSPRQTA